MFRYMALAVVVCGTATALATFYGVARAIEAGERKPAKLSVREH